MEVTVGDVAAAIEEFAPLTLQEEYDNSGLQIGRAQRAARGALVCLDVDEAVLDEASALGFDLVVSHHPLLFKGIKSFCGATRESRIAERALAMGGALYAAHTNLDFAPGGVSFLMGERLGLAAMEPLAGAAGGRARGVWGALARAMAKDDFLALVKEKFHAAMLRYSVSDGVQVVRDVALCGGSGMDLYTEAQRGGADAFVTGDAKYHDFQRGVGEMLLVDVGHRESERGAVELLSRLIRKKLPTFAVRESVRDEGPLRYY